MGHSESPNLTGAAYALWPINLVLDFTPFIGRLDPLLTGPQRIWLAVRVIAAKLFNEHRATGRQSGKRPFSKTAAAAITLARSTSLLPGSSSDFPDRQITLSSIARESHRLFSLPTAFVMLIAGSAYFFFFVQQWPVSQPAVAQSLEGLKVATFASGCFWCTEADFDKVKGVKETISGYLGGRTENPIYVEVSLGGTGHAEAVQLRYDPKIVTYEELLDYYWRHVDLLDGGGQFCDRGSQYRPVIFTHTPEQRKLAEKSKAALEKSWRFDKRISVEIVEAGTFTPAEDYHQNYHMKNPLSYRYYRYMCGRDARLKQLWGDKAMH